MNLSEFRKLVEREFGPNLQHATPANVREFLDRLQQKAYRARRMPRYEMREERACTYEEIVKEFFADVLEMPPHEAAILLWLVALELAFAAIEHHYSEQLDPLFRNLDEEG